MVDAVRDTWIFVSELDGETLVLDRRSNLIHQLNGTATFIWQRCGEGLSADQIADALVQAFDVPCEVANQDMQEFLRVLGALDLLESARLVPCRPGNEASVHQPIGGPSGCTV